MSKIGKRFSIYREYAQNLGQNHSDLLADHIQAKIIIVPAMNLDCLRYQSDAVVQPAKCSPEQSSYCGDIRFGHLSLPISKNEACQINNVLQSNCIVI